MYIHADSGVSVQQSVEQKDAIEYVGKGGCQGNAGNADTAYTNKKQI